MEDFDDVPFLTADEIVCYVGFGMLAVGMIAGLLFMAVPVLRWGFESLCTKWQHARFVRLQTQPNNAPQGAGASLAQPLMG